MYNNKIQRVIQSYDPEFSTVKSFVNKDKLIWTLASSSSQTVNPGNPDMSIKKKVHKAKESVQYINTHPAIITICLRFQLHGCGRLWKVYPGCGMLGR